MSNTQPISTHKLIIFIVFICAAIMTSLFIYHANHKPNQPILAPDIGLLFPAPREIKSFELMAENGQKFTEKNLYHHWTLLFFGFTHCSNVCPTTLDMIKRVYSNLYNQYPNLQVVLVSVDPERDTPESLAKYTQSYHPQFIGLTGKIQELRKLQSQLGIFSARDTSTSDNYQVQHTSSIMLVNPQGKWAGIFKYGLKPDEFAKGIEASIRSYSALHS
ncbi:MAG: SCO family protein [Gammaproteobacteria bacterium]|nr:SCO family protein [Gammaproteobacteria bacterium]MCW5583102.1 SCO family protein [Gammaproteobacteria bacterium]